MLWRGSSERRRNQAAKPVRKLIGGLIPTAGAEAIYDLGSLGLSKDSASGFKLWRDLLETSVSGPLVADDFDDANGTALASHTPDVDTVGSGWTAHSGSWSIQSNKVQQANTAAWCIASIDSGVASVVITDNVDCSATKVIGHVVRLTDANNYYQTQIYASMTQVYEYASGFTLRAELAGAPNSGTHALQTTVTGTTISTYHDGTPGASYASANNNVAATRHGLASYNSSSPPVTADSFVIVRAT